MSLDLTIRETIHHAGTALRAPWCIPRLVRTRDADEIPLIMPGPRPPSLLHGASTPWPCIACMVGLLFGLLLMSTGVVARPSPPSTLPPSSVDEPSTAPLPPRRVPEQTAAAALGAQPSPAKRPPRTRLPRHRDVRTTRKLEAATPAAAREPEAATASPTKRISPEELGLLPVPLGRQAASLDGVVP